MDISLAGLVTSSLLLRNWNTSGERFGLRAREAFRLAVAELTSQVPEALLPDDDHVVLFPDQVSSAVSAHARTTSDRWVLEFTDRANVALGAVGSASTWRPAVDGTWDGIMHLEVQDTSGRWHRRQTRTWWVDQGAFYVSLDRPWPSGTETAMEFRVHQPAFFLRADVHKLLAPCRLWDETKQQQWPLEAGSAHRLDMVDFRGESLGRPSTIFRGKGFQMPTPYLAPTVAAGNAGWAGPWQEGVFTFKYTICWGVRDPEWAELPGGLRDPMWESAPSNASEAFNHAASAGTDIVISLPNIEASLNFGTAGTLRRGRSGFYLRIYVAQTSVRTAGLGAADFNRVEVPGIYYPLVDVDPDGTAVSVSWRGVQIPDRMRPLGRPARYFAWHPSPHQDSRYEMDLRVLRALPEVHNDTDTLPLHEVYCPAFVQLFLSHLCLLDGVDHKSSKAHLDRFNTLVEELRDADGSPAEVIEPMAFGEEGTVSNYGTYLDEP